MNEAIFEADHLLGDKKPAKPMTGDVAGDQPVTEQGKFEMIVERSRVTISPTDSYAYEAWAKGHNRTLERLTTAHNRDMEAARKRIAELEAENAQLREENDRLRQIIGEIHDEFYGQNFQVIGWHLNGETEPMDNIFDSNNWEV